MTIKPEKYIPLLALLALTISASLLFYITIPANTAHAANIEPRKKNGPAFDFDTPPETDYELTPGLGFGARAEMEYQLEENYDLDTGKPDNLSKYNPSASLAFSYKQADIFSAFLNIEPAYKLYDDKRKKKKSRALMELKQAFLSFDNLIDGLTVRIGRMRFSDSREWIYDEELDGIRIIYAYSKYALDVSVTEKRDKDVLNNGTDEKVTNYVLYGMYMPVEGAGVSAYLFERNNSIRNGEDPLFYGLSLTLETEETESWLELAHVRGKSGGNKKIRGLGLDIGSTYVFRGIDYKPAITLGYALGSGDIDPSDDTDENFRQTGLQDNSAKFNGVTKIKYYGEMLDPGLDNIIILTAGAGIRPTKKISADLVFHHFNQHRLSATIRDTQVDEDPDGKDRELGYEWDIVLGYRGKPHWKGSFTLGYFIPGRAFPKDAQDALYAELKIRYDF